MSFSHFPNSLPLSSCPHCHESFVKCKVSVMIWTGMYSPDTMLARLHSNNMLMILLSAYLPILLFLICCFWYYFLLFSFSIDIGRSKWEPGPVFAHSFIYLLQCNELCPWELDHLLKYSKWVNSSRWRAKHCPDIIRAMSQRHCLWFLPLRMSQWSVNVI